MTDALQGWAATEAEKRWPEDSDAHAYRRGAAHWGILRLAERLQDPEVIERTAISVFVNDIPDVFTDADWVNVTTKGQEDIRRVARAALLAALTAAGTEKK